MTTAFVGAGIVALGAGAAIGDKHADPFGLSSVEASTDLSNRLLADDRADRGNVRNVGASTFDQPAPDVWLLPVKLGQSYTVTSPFGPRFNGSENHPGVDLGVKEGTPIIAAARGKVILCRWNGGYGYNVMIDHGSGIISVYGHASKLLCKEGQVVEAGAQIALSGNTGHSFGPHLHFEIRLNDKAIDPIPFMKKHGVDIMTKAQAVYGDVISD